MKRRGKIIVGTGVATLATAVNPSPAQAHTSGVVYSEQSDCAGQWDHHSQAWGLMDRAGGDDDDYCYVDYGGSPGEAGGSNPKRTSIEEDSNIGQWQWIDGDMTGIGPDSLYFQVCEERQMDDDLCSSVHGPYRAAK